MSVFRLSNAFERLRGCRVRCPAAKRVAFSVGALLDGVGLVLARSVEALAADEEGAQCFLKGREVMDELGREEAPDGGGLGVRI